MMTTAGQSKKKEKILELLETKEDIFTDEIFKFQLEDCAYFANDIEFLMKLAKILHNMRESNWKIEIQVFFKY